MAAGDYRIGLDGKFYYGTAGSQAATEADNIQTCTLNLSARVAEAMRRGKTWLANKVTMLEGTVSFTLFDIEGDSLLSAIQTAFFGKAKIALYPTDAASGEGFNADFYITSLSREENNDGLITYSVEAKPTDETRDPQWT